MRIYVFCKKMIRDTLGEGIVEDQFERRKGRAG